MNAVGVRQEPAATPIDKQPDVVDITSDDVLTQDPNASILDGTDPTDLQTVELKRCETECFEEGEIPTGKKKKKEAGTKRKRTRNDTGMPPAAHPWRQHLKEFMAANPTTKPKEAMKLARETYVPKKSKQVKVEPVDVEQA